MQELKCESCGASFSTQAELAGHSGIHSEEHQHHHFKCEACGASFHSSSQLAEHVNKKHPMPVR